MRENEPGSLMTREPRGEPEKKEKINFLFRRFIVALLPLLNAFLSDVNNGRDNF